MCGWLGVCDILTGMRNALDVVDALLDEKEVISGDMVKQVIDSDKNAKRAL